MTEREVENIKRQWEIGVPIGQIVRTMPYSQTTALRHIWELQNKGVLLPRKRKRGVDLVSEAYNRGMTNPHEIAETYGYTIRTVYEYLKRTNPHRERVKHNWKKRGFNEQTIEILKCLEKGMGVNETARKFGVTKQWVSVVKKRSEKNE